MQTDSRAGPPVKPFLPGGAADGELVFRAVEAVRGPRCRQSPANRRQRIRKRNSSDVDLHSELRLQVTLLNFPFRLLDPSKFVAAGE